MSAFWLRLARRLQLQIRCSSRRQQAIFTTIFRTNAWGDPESVSGPGSSTSRGADYQDALLGLLDRFGVRSLIDAPCGDFNWMRNALAQRDLSYSGVDIVPELVAANVRRYAGPRRRFIVADMTRDGLPAADLILCRDGLVHLSYADARAALHNFRRSGSRYLLATTFVGRSSNTDVPTGGWRPLNLEAAPFRLPPPLALVDERCSHSGGIYRDKHLGLWDLRSTPL